MYRQRALGMTPPYRFLAKRLYGTQTPTYLRTTLHLFPAYGARFQACRTPIGACIRHERRLTQPTLKLFG